MIPTIADAKLIAALGVSAALVLGFGWHKHVVHDRDAWHTKADAYQHDRDAALKAEKLSEDRRSTEFNQAKDALADAGKTCDARVAEARRSAQSIRTIVEKPRAQVLDPVTRCPVPVLVPAGELRDALQPRS